jgi:cytochrome c biogenesis protein CcmG, thiol:disulfide interchange protein DsbE
VKATGVTMHGEATWQPGAAARDTSRQRPPGPAGTHLLAWGLIVLTTLVSSPAACQPAVTDLLGAVNLTHYPPGMKPPEFNGPTVEGPTVSLVSLRGRVVLLNFWSSWCLDCRSEMPIFEQLHRDFAAQGLTILGVNVREGTRTIRRYAGELDLTFPLVLDPKGKITASYGVTGLPTTFLIGRDGRPVALAIGPRHWGATPTRATIEALLAEPTVEEESR